MCEFGSLLVHGRATVDIRGVPDAVGAHRGCYVISVTYVISVSVAVTAREFGLAAGSVPASWPADGN